MDSQKENIEIENIGFEENYLYYSIFIIIIILGYLFYSYVYTEDLLENIEIKLTEMKELVAYYTNKILLSSNMEGDSIKATHVSSL